MKCLPVLLMSAFVLAACGPDPAGSGDAPRAVPEGSADAAVAPAAKPAAAGTSEAAPGPTPAVSEAQRLAAIEWAVNDADRPEPDRDRDAQRRPAEVLAFSGIGPGMSVLEVFSGSGYYTELLSELVGSKGEVWCHNPPQFYERFGSADLDERLAGHRLANVVRHDLPLDDLALPDGRFDAVVAAMVFHDFFWLVDDVPAVLAALHDALKPGGRFLITDHAAPGGTGNAYALDENGKHRIEEAHVVSLMEAAGFELVGRSDVLRQPDDDRTQPFFSPEMRGKYTDRFVLLFRRR